MDTGQVATLIQELSMSLYCSGAQTSFRIANITATACGLLEITGLRVSGRRRQKEDLSSMALLTEHEMGVWSESAPDKTSGAAPRPLTQ